VTLTVLAPARILHTLHHNHPTPLYGRELLDQTGLTNSGLYPTLAKLTTAGHITRTEQTAGTGPPRTYYQLTDAGHTLAAEITADLIRLLRGHDFNPDADLTGLVQHLPGSGYVIIDGGIIFTAAEVRAHARRLLAAADEADTRNRTA